VRADIAASFQRVAVQHLEERCRRAVQWAQESHPEVGGGLAGWLYGRTDGWDPQQACCLQ
jgi:N6-L-threonylcarbamoyladenine synthase